MGFSGEGQIVRVLIVNENVMGGGTEGQVRAEAALLRKMGHEVGLVTYDPTFEGAPIFEGHVNVRFEPCGGLRKWARQLRGERGFGELVASAVAAACPDVIHLNNVFSRPRDVYAAVAPWPVLQTLRDYSVICPRDYCCDERWRECAGWRCHGETMCAPISRSALQHCKLGAINAFRARAVDKMVSCSARMAEKCRENGMEVEQLRDLLAPERIFKDEPTHRGSYFFYGRLAEEKGAGVLLEAFDDFARQAPGARLMLAGSVAPEFESTFEKYEGRPWFEYLGFLDLEGLRRAYGRAAAVVVPSLCLDNYPNTALEAMANNTLVIGSNRGGIPEMLRRDELLFDPLDKGDVVSKLAWVGSLSTDTYDEIVRERSEEARALASEDRYYEGLMAAFEEAVLRYKKRTTDESPAFL